MAALYESRNEKGVEVTPQRQRVPPSGGTLCEDYMITATKP